MSFHTAALASNVKTTNTSVNTSLVVFCNLPQLDYQTLERFNIVVKKAILADN